MNRVITLLLSGSVIFVLSGCGTVGGALGSKARVNPNIAASYQYENCKYVYGDSTSFRGALDLDCFRFPEDRGGDGQSRSDLAYTLAADTKGANSQDPNHYRNRLQGILMGRANAICTIEKGKIVANEATTNASLGILTTGLATASSIVTGDLAKSILAGSAGFTSGTRDHLNANIWKNQLGPAITKAIDAQRTIIATKLLEKREKPHSEYTVDEMIQLVDAYHQSCSFATGLQVLIDAADSKPEFQKLKENLEIDSKINALEAKIAGFQRQRLESTDTQVLEAKALLKALMDKRYGDSGAAEEAAAQTGN